MLSVQEIALLRKGVPTAACVSKGKQAAVGFKEEKFGLRVMLDSKANGDCKLKPAVIWYAEDARGLWGIVRNFFPLCWRFTNTQ